MQTLVISTFSSVMQRPSGVKLWQHPAAIALPSCPFADLREMPEEVQATSYFAASARMESFVARSTPQHLRTNVRANICTNYTPNTRSQSSEFYYCSLYIEPFRA